MGSAGQTAHLLGSKMRFSLDDIVESRLLVRGGAPGLLWQGLTRWIQS